MKILVIFTGGTIGSVIEDSWISVNSDAKYKLIETYTKKYQDNETIFDTVSPYYILSENLSSGELTKLYKCINDNLSGDYHGIIVTHGTDTLQYTSSAMGLEFPEVRIPVVFVSSAYPLENPLENGSDNFESAVKFIKTQSGCGVFVSYKNGFENKTNIHIATRLKAHAESSADIFSIDNNPYAFVDNDVVLNDKFYKSSSGKSIDFSEFCSCPEILMIESMPGNIYNYNLDTCNAVILSPYHSATLDVDNENFRRFCIDAKEKGIPVFLVNVPSGLRYESVKKLEELNIISLPYCSKIATYMKCWIAISAGVDVREYVLKPVAQEFVENV